MTFRDIVCGFLLTVLLLAATVPAEGDINQKIASLDMKSADLDDVIAVFGQPLNYYWEGKAFSKDKLPAIYVAQVSRNLLVLISYHKVQELRFIEQDTGYRFEGKLGIGSSLQESLEVLGPPEHTVQNQGNEQKNRVLYKDIDGKKGTCYYSCSDKNIRLFFSDYKINSLYLTAPGVLQDKGEKQGGMMKAAGVIEPYTDVRGKDLSETPGPLDRETIRTLIFNLDTFWPRAFIHDGSLRVYIRDLFKTARNPGLGVRQLHQQGITGKGVTVAIIDQPLYPDHPEFRGKIIEYHDVGCAEVKTSMHGPAVASLLVGANCGTAPDAKLYFVAAPSWTKDTAYEAKALDWLIEKNRQLPTGQKIRVVSVSAAPSGAGSPFEKNTELWDSVCQRAEAEGMMVLDCTRHHGFIKRCYFRSSNVESPEECETGYLEAGQYENRIFVPAFPRTTAEQKSKTDMGYIYWGEGGQSWAIPYCAGVLAMGWQVKPDATPEQMKELLFKTAYETKEGVRIINPPQFIRAVEKMK